MTKITKNLIKWAKERGISEQESVRNDFIANIVEELAEWQKAFDNNDEHEKIDALSDIIVFAKTEILKFGYNPDKVQKETFKEINSRTGAWDEKSGKWLKDKTPEAKKLWYKADYSNCKL